MGYASGRPAESRAHERDRAGNRIRPMFMRDTGKRLMGFEPTTFCMASRRSSQLSYSRVNGGF
jgi:hypothetical protein